MCHDADRTDAHLGPGLRCLFERERLPVSGRPATEENARRQLTEPYQDMPSFSDLPNDQVEALIGYLKTL